MRYTIAKLKSVLDANIGRCAYCMGTAFLSALAAWAVYAGVQLLWPSAGLADAFILLPVGLSLLWTLHLTVYTGRVLAALHAEYGPGGAPPEAGRRDMLWMFGTAVSLGLFAAVWLPVQALAAGQSCGDGHCPDDAANCCRSVKKCCDGIWACTKTGTCHANHTSARKKCGQDGIVVGCG